MKPKLVLHHTFRNFIDVEFEYKIFIFAYCGCMLTKNIALLIYLSFYKRRSCPVRNFYSPKCHTFGINCIWRIRESAWKSVRFPLGPKYLSLNKNIRQASKITWNLFVFKEMNKSICLWLIKIFFITLWQNLIKARLREINSVSFSTIGTNTRYMIKDNWFINIYLLKQICIIGQI